MNVKTSELSDAALDWAVEVAIAAQFNEGRKLKVVRDSRSASGPCWIEVENSPGSGIFHRSMHSTDWSQGGPIIEREQLWLTGPFREREDWKCGSGLKSDWDYAASEFTGPTPLIAAMRCFVASKLGDVLDVPEELA